MERIYVKYSQLLNSSLSFIFAMLEARATPAAFWPPVSLKHAKLIRNEAKMSAAFFSTAAFRGFKLPLSL